MKHTIQALVENKFGVLSRVASLFSARGYNIDSLVVAETQDPTVSCMTIVVNAPDEKILEQIKKQLHKLIDVITVADFTHKEHVERELLLVKIVKNEEAKKALLDLEKHYPAKTAGETKDSYIVEACVDKTSEEGFLKELQKLGIKELIRTGKLAIGK